MNDSKNDHIDNALIEYILSAESLKPLQITTVMNDSIVIELNIPF